jgi:HB1, ASXL, restriction endonuclease HTH domain
MAAKNKTTKSRLGTDQPPPEANGMPAAASTLTQKSAASHKPKPTKAKKAPTAEKAKAEKTKAKKTSALDAAARVLGETGKPMNCQEMIAAMAAKGYWHSPGGKTPSATLYSAILRELKTKKNEARFRKTERGKFELRGKA